jgi:hypothetical protein
LPAGQIARLQGRGSILILENTFPRLLPGGSWGVSSDVLWRENKKKERIFKKWKKKKEKRKKESKGVNYTFIT